MGSKVCPIKDFVSHCEKPMLRAGYCSLPSLRSLQIELAWICLCALGQSKSFSKGGKDPSHHRPRSGIIISHHRAEVGIRFSFEKTDWKWIILEVDLDDSLRGSSEKKLDSRWCLLPESNCRENKQIRPKKRALLRRTVMVWQGICHSSVVAI
jgi:hypothetical protein